MGPYPQLKARLEKAKTALSNARGLTIESDNARRATAMHDTRKVQAQAGLAVSGSIAQTSNSSSLLVRSSVAASDSAKKAQTKLDEATAKLTEARKHIEYVENSLKTIEQSSNNDTGGKTDED